ncbi:MAG TPA: YdeI/OmpD-associated family protein [Bacteroidia bacterium]|nr:YdeI/OmpD-associated family protein [Bacteroidia bacterium]
MKDFEIVYSTPIQKLEHLVSMRYLEVPPKVIKKLGGTFKVRLLCTVNKKITFQGGLVALGNGSGYVSFNLKRMKEIGVKDGEVVQVILRPDPSKYGMEVPLELAELFRQDKEGKKRFDGLSPGKQRYVLHYVSAVKNTQKRVDRAILLIENLKKLPKGKENFRDMLGL